MKDVSICSKLPNLFLFTAIVGCIAWILDTILLDTTFFCVLLFNIAISCSFVPLYLSFLDLHNSTSSFFPHFDNSPFTTVSSDPLVTGNEFVLFHKSNKQFLSILCFLDISVIYLFITSFIRVE